MDGRWMNCRAGMWTEGAHTVGRSLFGDVIYRFRWPKQNHHQQLPPPTQFDSNDLSYIYVTCLVIRRWECSIGRISVPDAPNHYLLVWDCSVRMKGQCLRPGSILLLCHHRVTITSLLKILHTVSLVTIRHISIYYNLRNYRGTYSWKLFGNPLCKKMQIESSLSLSWSNFE